MAAVIRIEVQTSGGVDNVKKDLENLSKTAEQSGSGFNALGEIATGMFRAVGEAITGFAIKGFEMLAGAVQDGIADAQNNAKIQAQTAQVIKSTGEAAGVTAEHVADYASSLSDAAGASLFGDDQVQQSSNLLLTFTNIKGKALDAATAISVDMAQALGGAPKDAAIQLGKALNDPTKGITALQRVGVTFTDQQKAQIQAMQEAGNTAGAQEIILAELNKEFGGSAKAAADATGGWSEFNGRMGEARETIGTAILPILSMLADVLVKDVMPVIESLATEFAAWLNDPATRAGLAQIVDAIKNGLAVAFTYITTTAIPALIAGWALIQPALAAAGAFIIDTLVPAIGTLITWFQTNLPGAIAILVAFWNTTLLPIFNDLVTVIFPLVGAAIQIFVGFWNDVLLPAFAALWSLLTTVVFPVIAALAGWLRDNLPGAIQAVADFLTGTLFPALNKIYNYIQTNVIPILATVAQWLIVNVPIAIQKATDYWNTVLWPALNKVWLFIRDNVIPIITQIINDSFTALNTATQEVANFWKNTLEPALRSVWSFIDTYVNPLLLKLANVVIAGVKLEVDALAKLWNTVLLPAITAVWSFINDKLIPIFKDLVEKHIAGLKSAFEGIAKVWNETLKPAFDSLASLATNALYTSLASLNDNILKPMKGFFEGIGTAVSDLITLINGLIKKFAEVKIPSWLEGNSPPPMADWFSYIADSVKDVNAQLPAMQMNLAAQMGAGGNSTISNASSRSFTYAPQITTSGNVSAPMDLALATSLAGV